MKITKAFARFWRADGLIFASALAFLTLLALVPALAVAYWLGEQHELFRRGEQALRELLYSNLLPEAAQEAATRLDRLRANARGLGTFAVLVIALDLVVKSFALHAALDRLFRVAARGVWAHVRGLLALLVLVPASVGLLYVLLRSFEGLLLRLLPSVRALLDVAMEPLVLGVPIWAGLSLLYRLVSPHACGWRTAMISALAVTIGIELTRWALSTYVANLAALRSLYGTLIAVPVLLLSVLAFWVLVLLGAALVAEGVGERASGRIRARFRTR
ncbi:MAG: YihY family inner membrane protein [Casimicrobiaceae bacterium]|nr:YihY family inner membrane protein [Casimicrobiaceae bacterium]